MDQNILGGKKMEQRIIEFRKQISLLGKEVAELHSTTQFPEWIHFKIGISTIEGYPYEPEFWERRIEPGVTAESN